GDVATLTGAALWRHDAQGWSQVEVPEGASSTLLYKVWGASADDVWVCGDGGVLLHYDGEAWSQVTSPTTRTLFTVSGTADQAFAVGGFGDAAVLRWDGASWVDESPFQAPQLSGVTARGD